MMERRLVERARAGDLDAYDHLVGEYQSIAFRAAFFTLGDADEAEDAVQEAFVKAYLNLGSFDAGLPFRPWLLRIVTNEALNRSRTSRRQAQLQLRSGMMPAAEADPPLPEDLVVAGETRTTLIDALNRLPGRDRALIAYRYFLEFSPSEIAEILEKPASTVRTQLSRALNRLRALLIDSNDTTSSEKTNVDGDRL